MAEDADQRRMIPHYTRTIKTQAFMSTVQSIRTGLAAQLGINEESIEISTMMEFYTANLAYARIRKSHPEARILKEELPEHAILAYR